MNEGLTHRRKRDAQKRAATQHRERVAAKLIKRQFLKDEVRRLETLDDREPSDETHQLLIKAKAKLRSTDVQLRAYGDVDL